MRSLSEAPDLFAMAGALANLLGAPVTIEDHDARVLAYSDGQMSADQARTATILGRQVPPEYREALRAAGVYRRIATQDGVVYADLADAGMKPRAVVGIRAGDELLGSIWALVPGELTAAQEKDLLEAAPIVADALLRNRARDDRAGEQVAALLEGGADAEAAAARLGLAGRLTVLAVATTDATRVDRTAGALTLRLAASGTTPVSAVLDGVLYVVVPAEADVVHRIGADFLRRGGGPLVAGVGRTVPGPAQAHRSRSDADSIVRMLAGRGAAGVALPIQDAFVDVVTARVAEVIEADDLGDYGPLAALERFDADRGTELVKTARAYLARGGDVSAAAADLTVHPNTLRNRLRRAQEAVGVDLDDADTRLALMLQLKAAALADRTARGGERWPPRQ
ncbi:CdaR family transcriptional regulator [Jiangella sp. DSM 45060]|uniref:PucR family transcriptional regulator n=1 Tax=Jiangella sp. DSM 45060 TaxID=1798224 RepID=UPI00087AA5F2|nr:PucR family transcriptional regulator [Jiangella sp. DSM 45060]SDS12574.1 DNA-binding transcriptional regulator, PucR family [Jiangella sp. DSM 45060]